MSARPLSTTFRSLKPHHNPNPNPNPNHDLSCKLSKSSSSSSSSSKSSQSKEHSWSVYLILSTNIPIKTYVGVTTNFSRRLRQHNGELKGGAKASCAGRPWVCACIIQGFKDQSEACEFESKWKSFSRKLPRKRKNDDTGKHLLLLQHRQVALNRVKDSINCSHLEIDWQLSPS
ncbi:Structure-specific endonuclease subunit slx1 [Camellia lanceoleosa]|uniref:Structure-specific endonuclease subunit slx1 n=1 Tax=Camellia lanceoleosa TaxID=1840588 RepID=A0ACC0IFS8_9ERIC|nr:Structure-specific endonuclease subunit slx1 [Camellia lanceoleosa]